MRLYYKNHGRKIAHYPCVSIYDPKFKEWDDTISGEHGEIWEDIPGKTYKAFMVSRNRTFEQIFRFKYQDLRKWIERINAPFNADRQVAYARQPNDRLEEK